jgi:hypothetical protein
MSRKKTPLEKARNAFHHGKFTEVLKLLEPFVIDYRDSFDFHYMLGTSCLYLGDIGGAELYYKRARNIKMLDVNLINAQAVLYLRRGEVNKAVEYYLEAQEYDLNNATTKKGLDFIRRNNTPERLEEAKINNDIKKLYPRCKKSSFKTLSLSAAVFIGAFLVCYYLIVPTVKNSKTERVDLSDLVLTVEDRRNSLETNLTTENFRYILTEKQLTDSYMKALNFFQNYRDNAAQVEVNRILNSNASASVRQKARLLMAYFENPGFDNLKDNYSFMQISEDPYLYLDCWVIWAGRVTNVEETTLTYRCDFLAGYDKMKQIDGIVPLVFKQPIVINTVQPLTILAKIGIQNGKLFLEGSSVYQPINKK